MVALVAGWSAIHWQWGLQLSGISSHSSGSWQQPCQPVVIFVPGQLDSNHIMITTHRMEDRCPILLQERDFVIFGGMFACLHVA